MTEKQHKQGCKANLNCLVYHADGVCPGPYGKCTCDTIPDSKEGQTHYFGDGCTPEHTKPKEFLTLTPKGKARLTCKKAHCKCMNSGNQCTNHHYSDSCFGEKPVETWEERYDVLVKKYITEENVKAFIAKAFIAKEIQSAVEAERRWISEEINERMFHCEGDDCMPFTREVETILAIINPKK